MPIGLHDEPPAIVPMGSCYHLYRSHLSDVLGEPQDDYPASRGSKGARMLGRIDKETVNYSIEANGLLQRHILRFGLLVGDFFDNYQMRFLHVE